MLGLTPTGNEVTLPATDTMASLVNSSVRSPDATIVFATERRNLAACFTQALELEFPQVQIIQVTSLSEILSLARSPMTAVFVDPHLLPEVADIATAMIGLRRPSTYAVLQHEKDVELPVAAVFAVPAIRGILPMETKLDVWLTVIRLLLNGGEYFPSSLFRQNCAKTAFDSSTRDQAPTVVSSNKVKTLTEREMQILGFVARGLQNKNIAASLTVSEHTVKIHLHNIMTKLGATNRTEAAAAFHRYQDDARAGRMTV